ncbi:T9SS type B sorting domain-containing protein [Salegentibacter sp. F188]|uniref:T9SS type B sorting domain-containing protein n=1 Tax=Autumnicola patrickiae TaxID=3075591 RepID=A0ABU3E0E1_9FLAO|nr:T9SS type B sorting domain-containing protein [Salegentibacter sp. F188]MDT0689454.1 T9SS type B sorting domain-containing protein [Salegentibacter sp. F188]
MKFRFFLRIFTIFIFITAGNTYGQGSLCEEVDPFCAGDEELVFPNSNYASGSLANGEAGPFYGCLLSQPFPAWFYLQIENSGNLRFQISQFQNQDGSGARLDVDFAVWGPFSEDEDYCNDAALSRENLVDCSFSESAIEGMTINNAQADDIYIVLITNFSESPGYISLQQTNSAQAGAGATDCSILESTLGEDRIACGEEEVVLDGTTEGATDYEWYTYNETSGAYDLIAGETSPTLNVTTSGNYRIVVANSEVEEVAEDDVNVTFYDTPVATLPEDFVICSKEGEPVNLTEASAEILAGNSNRENYSVIYYESQEAAEEDIPVNSPAAYSWQETDQIFAQVVGVESGCRSQLVSFDLDQAVFPEVNLSEVTRICLNPDGGLQNEISIGSDLGSGYSYQWRSTNGIVSNEAVLVISEVPTVESYRLVLTNNETGCSQNFETELQYFSAPAEVLIEISGSDFTGGTTVTAEAVHGVGDPTEHEYQLNDGNWQPGPVFRDVNPGTYVVSAREINGCGVTISDEFTIIGYMRFFTPNSDGYNDTWTLANGNDEIGITIRQIYIFDRFGRFLKQISPSGPGWDGTVMGENLPADDYWFKILFVNELNGQSGEFSGNFSLIR